MVECANELVDGGDPKPVKIGMHSPNATVVDTRSAVSRVEKSVVRAMIVACFFGTACREMNAPIGPPLSGSFALTRVNGRSLPDTETIALSEAPGGGKLECVILRTSGVLVLKPATNESVTGTFSITLNARNACTDQEWVILTELGTYSQNGLELSATEAFPDHPATLTGEVDGRSITIHGFFHDYTFAR
jgi:hypothetical protein